MKGYSLFVVSFKVLGLEIIDERRMADNQSTSFFI